MSRAAEASLKRMAAVERGEEPEPIKQARRLEPGEKSLPRKILESSLYDGQPVARFLLNQLAVLAMDENSEYPKDSPYTDEKEGWCWMSQWQMSLRLGTDSHGRTMRNWVERFRKDGVVLYRDWYDDHGTHHAEYKVVEEVVDAFQRPKGKEAQLESRPSRYKEGSRKANGTSFSAKNQPGMSAQKKAIMEEDDE